MKVKRLFVATKAFVRYNNKVLVVRESKRYADGTNIGGYDVVGGRVRPGQRFDESLLREVKEESGLEVKVGKPFFVQEWRPVVRGEQWQIVGIYFECFADSDKVVLGGDHDDYKWINPEEYNNYNLTGEAKLAFKEYLDRQRNLNKA